MSKSKCAGSRCPRRRDTISSKDDGSGCELVPLPWKVLVATEVAWPCAHGQKALGLQEDVVLSRIGPFLYHAALVLEKHGEASPLDTDIV